MQQDVCGTNGYSLLSNVQAAIQQQLAASGPLSSIGGTIRARDIANIATPVYGEGDPLVAYDVPTPISNRGWDAITLRGLYALAQRYRAPRSVLSAIEADIRAPSGQPLSPQTVQYAIWLTYYSTGVDQASGNPVYGRGSVNVVGLATSPRTIYPLKDVPPTIPTDRVVDTVLICAPPAIAVPTESPIVVTTSFTPNVPLILAVLAVAAVGVGILTNRVPVVLQLRRGRGR